MGKRDLGNPSQKARPALAAGAILAALVIAGRTAHASIPLPYDFPAPPPNLNVVAFYNEFSSANSFYTPDGTRIQDSRIQADVSLVRLIHTCSPIDGMPWGVQVLAPYIAYLGSQQVFGVTQSANSGFAEPQFSAFIYPYSNPSEDSALAISYFLSPPVGSYGAGYTLNAGSNNWVNNIEVLYSHMLFGSPKGRRLELDIAGDAFFYSANNDVGVGPFRPVLHTEPAEQIIVYLPYVIYPKTAGYVGLTFEQTFGGKQYLSYAGQSIDTVNRNDATQIGIDFGSFVAPTVAIEGQISTDIRVRGGPKSNAFLFQAIKVF